MWIWTNFEKFLMVQGSEVSSILNLFLLSTLDMLFLAPTLCHFQYMSILNISAVWIILTHLQLCLYITISITMLLIFYMYDK